MIFNSLAFVAFFVVVYALYVVLEHRPQNYLLLVASYFFYGCWDWRFLGLIFVSTVVDYLCGQLIHKSTRDSMRRVFLVSSICVNLGILFTFKYFNFFAEGFDALLAPVGLSLDSRIASIILPVGISFYTFQTMSYTIDIYRRELEPTRDFLSFAVFVAYFPQLVAGPIERARVLLPQIVNSRPIGYSQLRDGMWLILLGYFKKMVLADNMIPFVKPIFDDPHNATGFAIVVSIYAAAFQIYGDFSGYSNIARGISKLMGIELMTNFERPYFATNPSDFWRRWHVSLSTWLRDYLYVPLGGNRHGERRTYRNLMLTMLLGGLWHGAAYNFVAWGLFHGTILAVHRRIRPWIERLRPDGGLAGTAFHVGSVVGFFHLTCVGWLLFFVHDLGDVPILLGNIFDPFVWNGRIGFVTILVFASPLLLMESIRELRGKPLHLPAWPRPLRLAVFCAVAATIVLCGALQRQEFIYFQF